MVRDESDQLRVLRRSVPWAVIPSDSRPISCLLLRDCGGRRLGGDVVILPPPETSDGVVIHIPRFISNPILRSGHASHCCQKLFGDLMTI
jgi:hypothetical protein